MARVLCVGGIVAMVALVDPTLVAGTLTEQVRASVRDRVTGMPPSLPNLYSVHPSVTSE